MNKVILIGRLTKDPETRQIPSGSAVTSFTVAIDRTYTSRDGERSADFIPIVTWNKTAENCAKYLAKGSRVGISGRLQTRSYVANDGTKRYITKLWQTKLSFLLHVPNSRFSQNSPHSSTDNPVSSNRTETRSSEFPLTDLKRSMILMCHFRM